MDDSVPMEPWQIRDARLRQLRDCFAAEDARDFLDDVARELRVIESLRAQLAEYRAAITALDCWMEKHDPKASSDYWRWRHRYHAIVNDARGAHE